MVKFLRLPEQVVLNSVCHREESWNLFPTVVYKYLYSLCTKRVIKTTGSSFCTTTVPTSSRALWRLFNICKRINLKVLMKSLGCSALCYVRRVVIALQQCVESSNENKDSRASAFFFLKKTVLIQVKCQLQHSLKCCSAKSVHSVSCATLLVVSGPQGSSFSFLLQFTRFSELGKCHFYCLCPSHI